MLEAWGFPGRPTISFDVEHQDIQLNGKKRSAKGNGVRALPHAALKVALLVYCDQKQSPQPTPLPQ